MRAFVSAAIVVAFVATSTGVSFAGQSTQAAGKTHPTVEKTTSAVPAKAKETTPSHQESTMKKEAPTAKTAVAPKTKAAEAKPAAKTAVAPKAEKHKAHHTSKAEKKETEK